MSIVDFHGKKVIVTGASEGIGREIAIQLASLGSHIVICARRKEKIQEVVKECSSLGNGARVYGEVCDISSPEQCKRLIDASTEHLGGIDIIILNAAAVMWDMFVDIPDPCSDVNIKTKTNYLANVYLTHYALPHILKSKGQICPVSSLSGSMGTPMVSFYASSKAALQTFFDGLRVEFELDGAPYSHVNICMLRLGTVSTDSAIKNTSQNISISWSGVRRTVIDMLCAMADRKENAIISHPSWQIALFQMIGIFAPKLSRLIMKIIFKKAPSSRRKEKIN